MFLTDRASPQGVKDYPVQRSVKGLKRQEICKNLDRAYRAWATQRTASPVL
jgi:hypothetical protein